jgi:hypothetical protein
MALKITVNDDNNIQFENVYVPIIFKSRDGETISIVMRDSGFEFNYQGEWYDAQRGEVSKVKMIDE